MKFTTWIAADIAANRMNQVDPRGGWVPCWINAHTQKRSPFELGIRGYFTIYAR